MNSINYSFKFGNTKYNVDIGRAFSGTTLSEAEKHPDPAKFSHYHAKTELFFVENDPITIHTEGGATKYRQCVVCVPPFCAHYTERSSDYCILFSCETKEQKLNDFSLFYSSFFSSKSIFSFDFDPAFRVYLTKLRQLIVAGNSLNNEATTAVLSLIFHSIYENNAGQDRLDCSVKGSYLLTIEKIINSDSLSPTREITLSTVADTLHLGKKQTSRIIYQYYGKSLSELVNEKRLSVASNLLLTTNKPISQIAKESNFNSENYFYIQFRKTFGCTPLAYRKKGIGE